jgi:uncharacterized protein
MGLVRLIIFIAIGWLLFRLIKNWQRRLADKNKPTGEKIDTMVKCATCGVHLPRQNAIKDEQLFFCCEEHKNTYSEH